MKVKFISSNERLTIFAVSIILAISILACSLQGKGNSRTPSQHYDANGITFDYPLNWEVISPDHLNIYVTDYTYLAVLADKDESRSTVARIVIAQTDKTFNDYIAGEKDYYQKQYKDQYSVKNLAVNGISATQFESTGSALSGEKRKSLNIYFEHANKIYYLTFSTLAANYDKVKTDFDLVVNSFQIK